MSITENLSKSLNQLAYTYDAFVRYILNNSCGSFLSKDKATFNNS